MRSEVFFGLGLLTRGTEGLVALPRTHVFNVAWLGNGVKMLLQATRNAERGLAALKGRCGSQWHGGKLTSHVWLAPIGPYSPHLPESSPLERDARSDKSSLSESPEAQGGIDLLFLHGAAAAYCAGGTQL